MYRRDRTCTGRVEFHYYSSCAASSLVESMNKDTLASLAVVLVGVAVFGTVLAFSEQPTARATALQVQILGIRACTTPAPKKR